MPYTYDHPHPAVTTDVVAFSIRREALQVVLIKRAHAPFRGRWALPGGFVEPGESLDDGARRELAEETGLRDVYLQQLHAFGRPDRDPRERVITIAYYALVAPDDALQAASDAADAAWFDVQDLPPLAFDHAEILDMARLRLAAQLDRSPIALHLMPEQFTLAELQQVYEHILGAAVDESEFTDKILASNALEATGATKRTGDNRHAKLYRESHRQDPPGTP